MLPDTVVVAHLRWLEMRGHTPASVYARFRALARLTAWLSANVADGRDVLDTTAGHTQPWQVTPGRPASRGAARVPASLTDVLLATADDLAAWRESLTTGPAATVNYISHAREFYAWCVRHGLREDNPAAELPVPRLPRRLPRPVSEPDLMAALAQASARVRPWLVLAGWAGLRAREIAYLRRENVLDTRVPPVLLVAADAGKGRRERLVPASAFVLAELQVAGLPARGWVFPRHDGQPGPNAPHIVSQLAGQALREAGTTATLHQLRHRYGTLMYQAAGAREAQEVLGHSSLVTTAIYADWDRQTAAAAAESLPVPGRLRVVRRESV